MRDSSDGITMGPDALAPADAMTTARTVSIREHMAQGALVSSAAATVGWFALVFVSDPNILELLTAALVATVPGACAGGVFHALFAGKAPRRPRMSLAAGAALAALTAAAAFVSYGVIPVVADEWPWEWWGLLVAAVAASLGVAGGRRALTKGLAGPPPSPPGWGPRVHKGVLGSLAFHMCAGAMIAVAAGCAAFYEAALTVNAPEGWHGILAFIAAVGLVTGAGFYGVLGLAASKTDSASTAIASATLFAVVVEVALLSPLMIAFESSGAHGWARLAAATAVTVGLSVVLARASLRLDARTR